MTRMGWYAHAIPQRLAVYVELHGKVWPEITELLSQGHITNYTIFMDAGASLLFASFDYTGSDFAGDMARIDEHPASKRWQALVGSCLVSPSGEEDAWIPMTELFRLD